MALRSAAVRSVGQRSNCVSGEPGIMASRPGRVRGSVRSFTTLSRKSSVSPSQPSGTSAPITDSQRSSLPEASVVPRAGQATRTKRSMRGAAASSVSSSVSRSAWSAA